MDLLRVWEGQRWRREQDLNVLAMTIHYVRAMMDKNSDPRRIRKSLRGWPSFEDLLNG